MGTDEKKQHRIGKWLAVLELVVSVVFYVLLWKLDTTPRKYMVVIGVGIAMLFAVCLLLQFGKKTASIIGIVFSIGFILLFVIGSKYICQMDAAMNKVSGANYKTDSMVVVVKKNDKAKTIQDAKDYLFGYQMNVDTLNTELMMENVEELLSGNLMMKEYGTLEEMAQALLNGQIDAAIYNEGFNGMIGDTIEDYESKIRVLYQYGIDTKLEKEEKSIEEAFHVYISGIDVYGPITTNSRSDVNIIMTVNPNTKQILLTTTPRDYYLPIPGISGSQKDKLTHAGIYGVDKSMATLEGLYGIDINYYVRVNFTSLIKIIDVLNGVDVQSEYAFQAGGYSFQKGINHLNGEKALAFSRERHSFLSGDNQRGKNQEAVITGILNKAMSPAILKNANSLLANVSDSVETNMTKDEMVELIRMQLEDGAMWDIISVNAVGTGDSQPTYSGGGAYRSVIHPNMVSVSEISSKMHQVLRGDVIK